MHILIITKQYNMHVQVDILKNKLGFDDAFNYKKEYLGEALKRY